MEKKFRAWDNHVMYTPDYINEEGLACEIDWDDWDSECVHVNTADPVMQYTGLKDKNGKEIYEGDVVQHGRGNHCYKVIFDLYGYDPFQFIGGEEIEPHECEVIGNIYLNPELLP